VRHSHRVVLHVRFSYPWRDGVVLVVAMLATDINKCEVFSVYIHLNLIGWRAGGQWHCLLRFLGL
jgi:hypothetical protein